MQIDGIIWLRDIVDKISSKHHVETHEAEEVFSNRPQFLFVEKGDRQAEGQPLLDRVGQRTYGAV